jgi:periplasmic protein TonB
MSRPSNTFVIVAVLALSTILMGQSATRVRVSEGVSQAFVIKKVPPTYPQEARDQRVEGTVVMKVEISTEGDVTELTVISGPGLLAPAAVEAAKQWKYKPYLLNGQPIAVETQITLNFKLSG